MAISTIEERLGLIDTKNDRVSNQRFTLLVLKRREQISYYSAQLDSLFSETLVPSTVRWPLLESWLLYNPEVEPMGILIWNNQHLIAAGLFALKYGNGFCRITKIGVEGEPYGLGARDARASDLLGEGLRKALQAIGMPWFIYLPDLPDADPIARAITKQLKPCELLTCSHSPQLWFDRQSGLNRYLSQNTRSAVAKAKNRIKGEGLTIDMQWMSEYGPIEKLMDEIVEVHRERNRQKRGHAILDDPSEAALFRETVLIHARAERIRLLTLRLTGSLAAFAIGVLDRGMLWIYANLASPNWLRYSPGTIINAEVVRSAYSNPTIKGVNWGPGLLRYKMSGDVKLIPSLKLMGWSSWPTRLAWLGRNTIRRVRNKISQSFSSETPIDTDS
ncbi:MAG: GNAT family N-acetyltransferase [Methylomicrobium sp.]